MKSWQPRHQLRTGLLPLLLLQPAKKPTVSKQGLPRQMQARLVTGNERRARNFGREQLAAKPCANWILLREKMLISRSPPFDSIKFHSDLQIVPPLRLNSWLWQLLWPLLLPIMVVPSQEDLWMQPRGSTLSWKTMMEMIGLGCPGYLGGLSKPNQIHTNTQ